MIKNVLKLALFLLVGIGLQACVADEPNLGVSEHLLAPPSPTLTVTIVGPEEMFLDWTDSAGADGYVIDMGNTPGTVSSFTTWATTPSDFQANHLQPNTQYCWQIRAYNFGFEISAPSNMVCLTTPGTGSIPAPTGVTAQAISDSRILITWQAVPNAIKYYVYEGMAAAGPYSFKGTVVAPETQFLSVNLLPATTYYYQIIAVLPAGDSAPSSPPASATTFGTGGGVFEGFWKFDEKTGSSAADSSGFGRTATLTAGATFGTTNRAPIDDNLSVLNATSGFATVANAPGFNLTGNFSVALWVNNVGGGDIKVIGMRAPSCGALGWEISQTGGTLSFVGEMGSMSYGVGLAANTWTHVAVTHNVGTMRLYINGSQVATGAYTPSNSAPNELTMGHVAGCAGGAVMLDHVQIYSRELTAGDIAILGTVPPAPTNLTVGNFTSVSMDLSWTATPNATSYIIAKGTTPGMTTPLTHSPSTPTYQGDHLAPGTLYVWTVRSVVNGLVSPPSNEAQGTTLGAPAAPTGVTAMVVGTDRIQIDWTAVSGAVKYYVFESINGGAYAYRGTAVAPSTTYTTVNLAAGTTYSYQIQAEDSGQLTSPMSAAASATTP